MHACTYAACGINGNMGDVTELLLDAELGTRLYADEGGDGSEVKRGPALQLHLHTSSAQSGTGEG